MRAAFRGDIACRSSRRFVIGVAVKSPRRDHDIVFAHCVSERRTDRGFVLGERAVGEKEAPPLERDLQGPERLEALFTPGLYQLESWPHRRVRMARFAIGEGVDDGARAEPRKALKQASRAKDFIVGMGSDHMH